jgi:hypothetical protein
MSTLASPLITALNAALPLAQQQETQISSLQQQLSAAQAQIVQQAAITVGPTYIPPGDLGAIFAKVGQPNTTLELGAGTFTGGALTAPKFPTKIQCAPGTILNLTAQPNTAGTGIAVYAPLEIAGGHFTGTATAFRVYSVGFYLHDFTADQLGLLVNLDSGGDGARISNGAVGTTFAQGIFCTADGLRVSNYTQKGSIGEHPIRLTNNGSTGHIPANAILTDLNLSQIGSMTKKEVLALRRAHGVTVQGTFNSWAEVGESDATSTVYASGIRFLDSQWPTARDGNGAMVQIRHDADVLFDNCQLAGNALAPAITGDARARLILRKTAYGATPTAQPLAAVDPTGTLTQIAV